MLNAVIKIPISDRAQCKNYPAYSLLRSHTGLVAMGANFLLFFGSLVFCLVLLSTVPVLSFYVCYFVSVSLFLFFVFLIFFTSTFRSRLFISPFVLFFLIFIVLLFSLLFYFLLVSHYFPLLLFSLYFSLYVSLSFSNFFSLYTFASLFLSFLFLCLFAPPSLFCGNIMFRPLFLFNQKPHPEIQRVGNGGGSAV